MGKLSKSVKILICIFAVILSVFFNGVRFVNIMLWFVVLLEYAIKIINKYIY